MFLNAGLNKFLNYMPAPEMDAEMQKVGAAMMTLKWMIPLVGLIEIIGGILFIIPKTRALGAIVILPVLAGVFVHNITFFTTTGVAIASVLVLINLWVLYENREKYKMLVS
jgi:uncharacterized membrane protein YphA (DoxX/SURF4 family)